MQHKKVSTNRAATGRTQHGQSSCRAGCDERSLSMLNKKATFFMKKVAFLGKYQKTGVIKSQTRNSIHYEHI